MTPLAVVTRRKLLHFAGLQAAWFAAALLASTPLHLLGAAANGLFVAAHVGLSGHPRREWRRSVLALGLGVVVELINRELGNVQAVPAGLWPPLWLLSLWPAFASTFMEGHSLHWLRGRPGVALVLGAVLGPLSYAGGARLGALTLDGWRSVACLAVTWAIAMVVLSRSRPEEA
jgi:hypothetical protein